MRKRKRSFEIVAARPRKFQRFIGPVMPANVAIRRAAVRRRSTLSANLATRGFLGVERKFYDTALVTSAIAAPTDASGGELDPSATSMISTPDVGDGPSQRDGRQISCLFCTVDGVINIPIGEDVVNPLIATTVFIAVVLDTQTNAAQMNSEDCFKNTGANAILAASPMKNLLFGKRFRILKQRIFHFDPSVSAEADNSFAWNGMQRTFRWFIPLKGMRINFNAGTTASVANVIDNSIHVVGYCTNSASTVTLSYNARLRFMG